MNRTEPNQLFDLWSFRKYLENKILLDYQLRDYYAWKAWLGAEQSKYGNSDYLDNWLFAEVEELERKRLKSFRAPNGRRWYLTATTRRHKICGKVFTAYELYSDTAYLCCEALCGFKFQED